jgi:hypothetical protein
MAKELYVGHKLNAIRGAILLRSRVAAKCMESDEMLARNCCFSSILRNRD